MPNIHQNLKEEAFEKHIEKELVKLHKYKKRSTETDYDKSTTFDKEILFEFLKTTQKEKLKELENIYGDALESRIIRRIDEEIGHKGIIDVLRKGIQEGPVQLDLMFFKPTTNLNPEIEELFQKNIFSVIRQLKFSQTTEQSVDMILFVNGIPIFTTELKNELTGQNVYHAIRQYQTDRDPSQKLFSFGRCVAHFALDTNEVFVTTELKEERTFFLPFNKGFNLGAGNPPVEGKHKTHYLWEQLFSPNSLSDLIKSFVHNYDEIKEDRLGKEYKQKVQLFPRYQQWDTVLKLISRARETGSGKNYLIQHSAGSGKSLTIAWLAYRLSDIHKSDNEKVYDTVIVLTDRRILDKQLRNTIKAMEAKPGLLISAGEDGTRLKDALESEAKIITTTIQKFPFVVDLAAKLSDKKFALIVDEAHSSQSGELTRTVHDILNEEEEDWLLDQLNSRKQPENISYFAFTATPKHETLERFGDKQTDGSFKPFSLYSMKQAIEEGFILDVLQNYTTYKVYFKLLKKLEEDPTVPRSRALSTILQYVNLHETTLEQKIEIIMAHFEQTIRSQLRGEAKAMIVTNSREAAVRYKLALDAYLRKFNYPHKTLGAFTGSIDIDGISYTETSLNEGVPEENTAKEFKKPEYRFLVVAEKYQTGFDEPYLCAMYVDKRLSGVQAVQTLSRLNRKMKDKDQVYVLDFVNFANEIQAAFEPYYTTTIISEGSDINSINDLRTALFSLYEIQESQLDEFVSFINPEEETIHEKANSFLDNLVKDIIKELPQKKDSESADDKYGEFVSIVNVFVKRYPYFAQVLGYSDISQEKLYLLLKYLLKKLPKDQKKPLIGILKYIDMDSVRIVKKIKSSIILEPHVSDVKEDYVIPGAPIEEIEDPLSTIINDVNKRWGVDFDKKQQETLNSMGEELASDENIQNVVTNNVRQNAEIHFENVYENKVDDQFDKDRKLYQQLRNNKDLNNFISKKMFKFVVDKIFALRDE